MENLIVNSFLEGRKINEGLIDGAKKLLGKAVDAVQGTTDANAKAIKQQVKDEKKKAKMDAQAQKAVEGDINKLIDYILKVVGQDEAAKQKAASEVAGAKAAMTNPPAESEQPVAEHTLRLFNRMIQESSNDIYDEILDGAIDYICSFNECYRDLERNGPNDAWSNITYWIDEYISTKEVLKKYDITFNPRAYGKEDSPENKGKLFTHQVREAVIEKLYRMTKSEEVTRGKRVEYVLVSCKDPRLDKVIKDKAVTYDEELDLSDLSYEDIMEEYIRGSEFSLYSEYYKNLDSAVRKITRDAQRWFMNKTLPEDFDIQDDDFMMSFVKDVIKEVDIYFGKMFEYTDRTKVSLQEKADIEAVKKLITSLGIKDVNAETLRAKFNEMPSEDFKNFGLGLEKATGQGAKLCGKIVSAKQKVEAAEQPTEDEQKQQTQSTEQKPAQSSDKKEQLQDIADGKDGGEAETETEDGEYSSEEVFKALQNDQAKKVENLLKALSGKNYNLAAQFKKAYDSASNKEEFLKQVVTSLQ